MNALLLAAVIAAVPQAPPVLPEPAPPVMECRCGGACDPSSCPCRDGECRGGESNRANVARLPAPHLSVTVADRGCPPCEAWERDTLPALTAAGWRVKVDRVPFGSESTPSFRFRDRTLDRYTTRAAFYGWLEGRGDGRVVDAAPARGPVARPAGLSGGPARGPHPAPAVRVALAGEARRAGPAPAPLRRVIPPARRQWWQNGHSVTAAHLRSHGIDPTGMSQQEMDRAHSHAHEGTWGMVGGGYASPPPVVRYAAPAPRMVYRQNCPGGRCPR